jgi:hypothetical protein
MEGKGERGKKKQEEEIEEQRRKVKIKETN